MRSPAEGASKAHRKFLFAAASVVTLASLAFVATLAATWAQGRLAQSAAVPQWQLDAGGKMAFDISSVKRNMMPPSPSTVNSNIPLGAMDVFSPTGGLFSATNVTLIEYLTLAYKIFPAQLPGVVSQLPKWASSNRYDIQARASGNPTKDQFRLMMQTLLADRFKLAIHYEARQIPVLALVLDRPGKLGTKLLPHPEGSSCSNATPPSSSDGATVAGGYPELCGVIAFLQPSAPGRTRVGGRNVSLAMFGSRMTSAQTGMDRPVIDKTGLGGKFDFFVEYSPQPNGPLPPNADFQPDPTGPTFMEALKDQLGLKLESQTGPIEVLVIDHVEEPSPN
jgi:uncharacterized protein (TIGR03435 family)